MWKIYNFKKVNNMGSLKNTFKKTALTQMHFSILIVCMEKELNVNSKCSLFHSSSEIINYNNCFIFLSGH